LKARNGKHPERLDQPDAEPSEPTAGGAAPAEPDSLKQLLSQVHELREFAAHYVSAKADSAKLSVQSFGLRIAAAAIGFVALSGLIVVAICSLVNGIAGGLGALFGERVWAGQLSAGLLVLSVLALGTWLLWALRQKKSRESTVRKYEARRTHQRTEFGHGVGDIPESGGIGDSP
jgi:hypothetical protein